MTILQRTVGLNYNHSNLCLNWLLDHIHAGYSRYCCFLDYNLYRKPDCHIFGSKIQYGVNHSILDTATQEWHVHKHNYRLIIPQLWLHYPSFSNKKGQKMQYNTSIVDTNLLNKPKYFKFPAKKPFQWPRKVFKPVSLQTLLCMQTNFWTSIYQYWYAFPVQNH